MDYRNASRWFGILNRRSQAYIVKACEPLDITFSEYVLILNLYDHEGVSQEDMAGLMFVDKAVVARTIKSLEAKGYVRRIQGEVDKRIKRIYTTEKGNEQEEFLRNVVCRWIDFLSAGLDPKTVEIVLQGFHHLSQRAYSADLDKI